MTTKNENKANQVKANAVVANQVEPQQKAIEQKRSDILKDCFKSIELSKIASDTRAKFEGAGFGKFTAIYRPSDKKENGKYGKSGGKTIYNFETSTTIYMGYTSSELSDVFNLPKREYKSNESKSTSPAVCELRKLKNYIDNLTSPLAIAFCKGMSAKISDTISDIIECEKAYDDFCDKYKTQIEQAQRCTLEVATAFCGEEFIKEFHDFGFKCCDEKSNESNESNESK